MENREQMRTPNLFSGGTPRQNQLQTQGLSQPMAMSLSEYAAVLGNTIRKEKALQGAWVVAELSDVRYSGGHCYMELIEKTPAGQTVAKLRANIWASAVQTIRNKFFRATGRDIITGLKVMVKGSVGHHPVYGLSFNIVDINPSYTLGDMERIRREILIRLQKDGVLDLNKAEVMPPVPQRIAVISAEGAAGYGDFMNQLIGNPDGFIFYPFLFPSVMQGEKTSASVREALDMIEQTIDLWDCVAIVRGGGATTDLNGFDDYDLAHRVATFRLPIVVGIGHERDRTVLDEIAHTRVKTPTAVAAFFIDRVRGFYSNISQLIDMITQYSNDRLTGEFRRLDNATAMIPALAEARLASARGKLDREMARLPMLVESRLSRARGKLDTLGHLTSMAADGVIKRNKAKLDSLEGMVGVLSPGNTLKRGYSITRVNGKALTDASVVKPGDVIETRLRDGVIKSEVKE